MLSKNLIPRFLLLLVFVQFSCSTSSVDKPRVKLNILFAISDDQSFNSTSYAGCNYINTPAFDRVAKEGVYFNNCYAGSPGCAPSRSSIVTGRYHWQNEQSGQHASSWLQKYVPFIDALEANGYVTGRTGKGVSPFRYAQTAADSLWRKTDAGGIAHSTIKYGQDGIADVRPATGINPTNYFENFKYFMENVRGDDSFFFWYGASEPHRVFEQDSWKKTEKKLSDVDVPAFLPDHKIVRGDLLDYAIEIEWFDRHLGMMLDYLEEKGELENTVVIVTSDNGMAFPRAKANCYEYGSHVPLAIRYPGTNAAEDIDQPVSFIDFAPTILSITDTSDDLMQAISGKDFSSLFAGSGQEDFDRTYSLSGRERHSSSRYRNWGYPQRAIRKDSFLLIWNIKPDRWPAGAPQKYDPQDSLQLLPMFGLDKNGQYLHQGAFTDIDDCPSKEHIIEMFEDTEMKKYFSLSHDKRPEYELYNVLSDPYCLDDLVEADSMKDKLAQLKTTMLQELTTTKDPRAVGPDQEVFDSYIRYSKMRRFPEPS